MFSHLKNELNTPVGRGQVIYTAVIVVLLAGLDNYDKKLSHYFFLGYTALYLLAFLIWLLTWRFKVVRHFVGTVLLHVIPRSIQQKMIANHRQSRQTGSENSTTEKAPVIYCRSRL